MFREGLSAVVVDPGTAVGVAFTEFGGGEHDNVPHGLAQVCIDVAATTGKPVNRSHLHRSPVLPQRNPSDDRRGIPVLDGAESALLAIHHAFEHRDFRPRARGDEPARPDANLVQAWRGRLTEAPTFDETLALELLGAFGIPATRSLRVASADAAVQAAREMGGPVALKTASGIAHKTDRDGVRLDLVDETAVRIAYEDLASRLGPAAVISPMAPAGVEIALSVIVDDDFGPLIMVGTGGVLNRAGRGRAVRTGSGVRVRGARASPATGHLPTAARAAAGPRWTSKRCAPRSAACLPSALRSTTQSRRSRSIH